MTAIGYATMDGDGTIHLHLQALDPASGAHGCALLTYPTTDPLYEQMVAHLGNLAPGSSAPYEPWPATDPNAVA